MLNFLCNLQIGQVSSVVCPRQAFKARVMLHSILLGPFVSYEENQVL
jgi:hypothetical protein